MAKKKPPDAGMGLNIDADEQCRAADEPAAENAETAPAPAEAAADEPPAIAADAPPPPRQGNQPFCPAHKVQMVAYSSNGTFTFYKCKVPECRKTDKRVRPLGPLADMYGHGRSAGK